MSEIDSITGEFASSGRQGGGHKGQNLNPNFVGDGSVHEGQLFKANPAAAADTSKSSQRDFFGDGLAAGKDGSSGVDSVGSERGGAAGGGQAQKRSSAANRQVATSPNARPDKTIKKVRMHIGGRVDGIKLVYADGSETDWCGAATGEEEFFELYEGEYITHVWYATDEECIQGILFGTSLGKHLT